MNLDLQRAIHSYQNELWPRHRVKNAVCDAIEGFCSEPVTVLPGPLSWPFDYIDGVRIVAQFDILKEEGV